MLYFYNILGVEIKMSARERLNEIKKAFNLKTDKELSEFIKTEKHNIDSWVRRNKIPKEWDRILDNILQKNITFNTTNHIKGDGNINIVGKNNAINSTYKPDFQELFYLIENYATPKIINDLKEKLLKIKELDGE